MSDASTETVPLSPEIHDIADRIVRRYPVARSALLPLLHLVQSEQNHITPEGIAFCAEKVGLTKAEVGAVATFYTMYKREPVGDWLLSVCTNPVCKQAGGGEIYENYKKALGGHRDPATKVTIEHAECLGICDGAPVVQVNYEMFGPMTVAEGDKLLADCRAGNPPVSPWSGEKPPTFAELERDLSGANDAWEAELHKAALQQIAFADPPTYRTGETDIPVTHPGGDPAGVGGAAFRAAAAGGTTPEPAVEPEPVLAPEPVAEEAPAEAVVEDAPVPTAEEQPMAAEEAADADVQLDIDGEPVTTPVSPAEFAEVIEELAAEEPTPEDNPVTPGEFAKVLDEAGDELADEEPVPAPTAAETADGEPAAGADAPADDTEA